MKRLSNFLDYINESSEISKEDIEDYLTSIKDLGIDYRIGPIQILTSGKFAGRNSRTILFNTGNFETNNMSPIIGRELIIDDRIWEFLDELISFKDRLNSDKVALHTGNQDAGWRFGICFLVGEELKSGKDFEMLTLFNEIRSKHLTGKSDFHNSMTVEMVKGDDGKNKIIIHIDFYTDRKLNLFLKGIDLSGFDIKKVPYGVTDFYLGGRGSRCDVFLFQK